MAFFGRKSKLDRRLCGNQDMAMDVRACSDREEIADEVRYAYSQAWLSADERARATWLATYRLIGGNKEDAVRLESLLPGGWHPPTSGPIFAAAARTSTGRS